MTEIKGLLAGQILLCYMNMDERELNVTSLARTLGVDKYAVSRALSRMEKEGLVNKDNPRKPILTTTGWERAKRFNEKMNIAMSFLMENGGVYKGIDEDAISMALALSDEVLKRMIGQRKALTKKAIDRDVIEGYSLQKYFEDGTYMTDISLIDIKRRTKKTGSGRSYIKLSAGRGMIYVDTTIFESTKAYKANNKPIKIKYTSSHGESNYEVMRMGKVIYFPVDEVQFACFNDSRILLGDVIMEIGKEKMILQMIVRYM